VRRRTPARVVLAALRVLRRECPRSWARDAAGKRRGRRLRLWRFARFGSVRQGRSRTRSCRHRIRLHHPLRHVAQAVRSARRHSAASAPPPSARRWGTARPAFVVVGCDPTGRSGSRGPPLPPCVPGERRATRRYAPEPGRDTRGGLGGAPAPPVVQKGRTPKPRAMVPACGRPKLHAHRPCRRQSRASRGRAGRGQRVPRGIRGLHAGRPCRCDAETRCRIRLPPPHGRR